MSKPLGIGSIAHLRRVTHFNPAGASVYRNQEEIYPDGKKAVYLADRRNPDQE